MIRFFKWCIVRHDDWKEMNRENGIYESLIDGRDREIKNLRERLEKIERGECYEGDHCQSCKHANTVTTERSSLCGTYTQTVVTCLLTVPCAKFEREE